MNPKRLVPAAFALLVLPLFVTDSQAQPRRRWAGGFREGYEVTVSVNLDSFEDKMELDDDTGAGVRFGYLFNPNHEIEFMYNGITANDRFFSGESAHIGNTQVSYVFNFTTHGVVPYVTAGLGWVHTNDTDLGSETDPVWSLGGGVRLFLGPIAYARFELRGNRFDGNGTAFANGESFAFTEAAFGFGWRFPVR